MRPFAAAHVASVTARLQLQEAQQGVTAADHQKRCHHQADDAGYAAGKVRAGGHAGGQPAVAMRPTHAPSNRAMSGAPNTAHATRVRAPAATLRVKESPWTTSAPSVPRAPQSKDSGICRLAGDRPHPPGHAAQPPVNDTKASPSRSTTRPRRSRRPRTGTGAKRCISVPTKPPRNRRCWYRLPGDRPTGRCAVPWGWESHRPRSPDRAAPSGP